MEGKKEAETISINETSGWLSIKDNSFEEEMLKDYKSRAQVVNTIVNFALSESAKGIVIYSNLDDKYFVSFMREVSPRLREIGVAVAIKTDDINKTKKLKNIVDYIVE